MFIVMMFVAFAANIITISNSMKYIFSGYDTEDDESLQVYIDTYQIFIDNMSARGEEIMNTYDSALDSVYLDRNTIKCCRDYAKLKGITLKKDYTIGVSAYAQYAYGIFFVVLFSFVLVEIIYFQEKKKKSLYMLKVAKYGRMRLAFAKWIVNAIMLMLFTVIQELVTILYFYIQYGFGDVTRSIQSVRIFRDCSYRISVFAGIMFVILIRLVIALVIGSIVYLSALVFERMMLAVAAPTLLIFVEFGLDQILVIDGSFDILKAVNLFYFWRMDKTLGEYHNLAIFNQPCDKNAVSLVTGVILAVICPITGAYLFARNYQKCGERSEPRVFSFMHRMTAGILHSGSLLCAELYKLFVQQKKWLILALYLLWMVGEMGAYTHGDIYSSAYEAAYHLYLSHIEGKITEESMAYIDGESKKMDILYQKIEQLLVEGQDGAELENLSVEYESRKEGYERLMEQVQYLQNRGKIYDQYFVDEIYYENIWNNYQKNILHTGSGLAVLIILISGMYAADSRYGTRRLILCTRNGRKKLEHSRRIAVGILIAVLYVVAEFPLVRGYWKVMCLPCMNQKLESFYSPRIESSLFLWMLLAGIFVCKALLFVLTALTVSWIAGRTQNELMVTAGSILIIIVAGLILYAVKTDITIFLIS